MTCETKRSVLSARDGEHTIRAKSIDGVGERRRSPLRSCQKRSVVSASHPGDRTKRSRPHWVLPAIDVRILDTRARLSQAGGKGGTQHAHFADYFAQAEINGVPEEYKAVFLEHAKRSIISDQISENLDR